jgi:hypothetical protein
LIGTTAGAGANAAGLTSMVKGLLRKDVKVVVNGSESDMQPVFINGKAYLPAREAATALGYVANWNNQSKQIFLKDKASLLLTEGVVESTSKEGAGIRSELLGKAVQGSITKVSLLADQNTEIIDQNGQKGNIDRLNIGTHVSAYYGPAVLDSNPPQAYALKIVIGDNRLIKEDAVTEVRSTDTGAQLVFNNNSDVVLNITKDTFIADSKDQPTTVSDIKPGTKIRAYYGPSVMKSIPLQSTVDVILILGTESPNN